ncbi:amino acid adenylation domain-containing protein [Rhodococcoides corynebacterioides]|uniref:amino acid adenylation domain-containing protein n=2 Tax=Rhodococcoides corynebacterioides TaxID=53972 RepID=UPI000933B38C|nr:non-ribosomal peptide synthetase [Rhodococcus corynebacterioides]
MTGPPTSRGTPLSAAQTPLWFAHHLAPDVALTVALHVRLDGPIDRRRLHDALYRVGSESGLRQSRLVPDATAPADPARARLVLVDDAPMNYSVVDLSGTGDRADDDERSDPYAAAEAWAAAEHRRPVDVAGTDLVRVALLIVDDTPGRERALLYLRAHHLVLDGHGAFTLLGRIADAYSGRPTPEPPLSPDVADRIQASETAYATSTRRAADERHWRDRLIDFVAPQSFSGEPPSRPRTPERTDVTEGGTDVDPSTAVAAVAVHVARTLDVTDVVLGFPVSVRTTAALRAAGGMMSGLVPLRLRVDDDTTVAELTARVGLEIRSALRHQRFRDWDAVVPTDACPYGTTFGPVVNIMPFAAPLVFTTDGVDVAAPVSILSSGPIHDVAVTISAGGALDLQWNPDRYRDIDVRRHVHRLGATLDALRSASPTTSVGSLTVAPDPETVILRTRRPPPTPQPRVAAALLADVVRERPDAPALDDGRTRLTYAEMDRWTATFAGRLRSVGARSGVTIALAIPRSAEFVLAWWATTRTGATILAVDPTDPEERRATLVDRVGAVAVVVAADRPVALPDGLPVLTISARDCRPATEPIGPEPVLDPRLPAYILFTSGSTGIPKGVTVSHAGLHAVLSAHRDRVGDAVDARVSAVAAPTVDASVSEMLLALATRGCLVIAGDDAVAGDALQSLMTTRGVTHAILTPRVLDTLDPDAGVLEVVCCVGEACPPDVAARWSSRVAFHDDYGPTETTVWATGFGPMRPGDDVLIGSPIPGTTAAVRDRRLRDVPVGVAGELYLGGVGLAMGYLNDAARTAERFVAAAGGQRVYRTGDRVRWATADHLEFLGRTDRQISLRGRRIEPGEIDAALRDCPGVRAAATVLRAVAGTDHLVSYVVGADPAAVEAHAARVLPAGLRPTHVVRLDALPLTVSGKLDAAALPDPTPRPASAARAPVGELETVLHATAVAALGDTVGAATPGVDDDFFAVGGDSISALRWITLAAAAGVHTTAAEVFEQRTPARVAQVAVLRDRAADDPGPDDGVGLAPALPMIHQLLARGGDLRRYAQTVTLVLPQSISDDRLRRTVSAVLERHPHLRARLVIDDDVRLDVPSPTGRGVSIPNAPDADTAAEDAVAELDPLSGRTIALRRVRGDGGASLLVVAVHHIVVDIVSWSVIVGDLAAAWQLVADDRRPSLAPVPTTLRAYATDLAASARRLATPERVEAWRRIVGAERPGLARRPIDPSRDRLRDNVVRVATLGRDATNALTDLAPTRLHCGPDEPLVAAVALALAELGTSGTRPGRGPVVIGLERHGRPTAGADLARTVGWLTALVPVTLDLGGIDLTDAASGGAALGDVVAAVKEAPASTSDDDATYGVLRYLGPPDVRRDLEWSPEVTVAHLGRLSVGTGDWLPVPGSPWDAPAAPDLAPVAPIEIEAAVVDGGLTVRLTVLPDAVSDEVADGLLDAVSRALLTLAAWSTTAGAEALTARDFPDVDVTRADLRRWHETHGPAVDVLPLAPLHAGMLHHARLAGETRHDRPADTGVDPYVVQSTLTIDGHLDLPRLRRAVETVLDRHDALRVAFLTTADGVDVQYVRPHAELPWAVADVAGDPDPDAVLAAFLDHDRLVGFDPADPVRALVRVGVVRLDRARHVVVVTHHHLVLDGWSAARVTSELLASYHGLALPAHVSPRTWLRSHTAERTAAAVETVAREFVGAEPSFLVPTGTRSPAQRPVLFRHAVLDRAQTDAIRERARGLGVTTAALIQTAWAITLGRATGRTDVVFGVVVSGRRPDVPQVDDVVGLLATTVPTRVDLHPTRTPAEVARRVQAQRAELLGHAWPDPATLRRAAGPGAEYDTVLAIESYPIPELPVTGGIEVIDRTARDATHHPLSMIVDLGDTLVVRAGYRGDLLTADAVDRLVDEVLRVLQDGAGDPEHAAAETITATATPPDTLPALLADAGGRFADHVALVDDAGSLTYAQLAARRDRLAAGLRARGVGPETVVAVALPRSVDAVIATHAVWAAGGAVLPLDVDAPADRSRAARDDAGCALAIGAGPDDVALADLLAPTDPRPSAPVRPDSAAYVLFTSGSTGRPKGVVVSHAAVVGQMCWRVDAFELGPADTVLHKTPATFDVSMWELIAPFVAGARVVVAPPGAHRDAAALVDLVIRHGVTVLHLVPSFLPAFTESVTRAVGDTPATTGTRLRLIAASGEVLPPDDAHRVAAITGADVINLYGPTEATVDVTAHRVRADDTDVVPLGEPVPGTTARVLDAALRPVPTDVVGELYLAGPQLARGYVGRPGLTAELFVAGPGGTRRYRTGDRVRRTPDDALIFHGRTDDQLSVRGVRLEPAEIETALRRLDTVVSAAVTAHEGRSLAVVTVRGDVTGAEIRSAVAEFLPRTHVPDVVAVVDALPTTPSGKVDRRALPTAAPAPDEPRRLPDTASERAVAQAFSEVLAPDRPIGADDDFHDLGGTSVAAGRILARIEASTGVRVPLRVLVETPTVRQVAAAVDAESPTPTPALIAGQRDGVWTPTAAQHRMYLAHRLDPRSYLMPVVLALDEEPDVAAVRTALADLVDRHEILRTAFEENGDRLVARAVPDHVPTVDVVDSPGLTPEDAIGAVIGPVDLAVPPLRVRLVRRGSADPLLILVLHHITADAVSLPVLVRDLVEAYTARRSGRAPASPLPALQFRDHAAHRAAVLGSRDDPTSLLAREVDRWRQHLRGLPPVTGVPTIRPSDSDTTGHRRIALDPEVARAVSTRARAVRTTPFVVVASAVAAALARWTGGADVALGTPVSVRPHPALDDMVGLFVETVVLRVRGDGSTTPATWVQRLRDETVEALSHVVPFDEVVAAVAPDRTAAHSPLVQVMVTVTDAPPPSVPGARVIDVGPGPAVLDLTVAVDLTGDTPHIDLVHRSTVDAGAVAGLAAILPPILAAVADDRAVPTGDVEIPAPALPRAVPVLEARTLADLLDEYTATDPSADALIADDVVLDRAETARRAARLARVLLGYGVGPEDVVAVALPRSIEQTIAVRAVAAAGAAFLALDPAHPTARLNVVLAEARPAAVITRGPHSELTTAAVCLDLDDPGTASRIDAGPSTPVRDADRTAPLRPDHPAYVVYTSGSTGTPKGVTVTHAGLHAAVVDQRGRLQSHPAARVLAVSAPTFDAAVGETVIALALRAPLVIAPADVFAGSDLADVLRRHRVTHAMITPRVLDVTPADDLPDLAVVYSAGEAVPPSVVATWGADPARPLGNVYGPTEATIWSSIADRLRPEEPVTVGAPTVGVTASVLDARLHPVPAGVVGELWLAGPVLARGYLRQPARTAERFVAAPGGARRYRTGDLVRWDGTAVTYLGRADTQYTVRGVRLELGEIEAALAAQPGVAAAAATVDGDRVVGVVVGPVDPEAVRTGAATLLPPVLRPAVVGVVDALPMTTSGKLDRAALVVPAPAPAAGALPQNSAEDRVADAVAEVCGVSSVGRDDDFFALGGTSLSAVTLARRLEVPVRTVFDDPTVRGLAAALPSARQACRPVTRVDPRPERPPLSFAQQRLWFLARTGEAGAAYTVPLVLALREELDTDALRAALTDVTTRHEVLRTVYPDVEGVPWQRVLAPAPAHLETVTATTAEVPRLVAERATRPFDLATDPPLRATLVTRGPADHVLVLVLHHIAVDGSSLAPLARDVRRAYDARRADPERPAALPALPVQYVDVALAQQDPPADALARWVDRLRDARPLPLPLDHPRPSEPSYRGARVPWSVDAPTTAALRAIAERRGTTLAGVMLAVLTTALSGWTGETDVCVGMPVSGRDDPVLDDLVGMLVDTVVVRTRVDPAASFDEHVATTGRRVREALADSAVPFEQVVRAIDAEVGDRDRDVPPLFQVMLAYQDRLPTVPGIEVLDLAPARAQVDLVVDVTETPAGLSGTITRATDVLTGDTARRLADMLTRIVDAAAVGRLPRLEHAPVLEPGERAVLLSRRGDDALPPVPWAELLQSVARQHPDGPAILTGDRTVTYADLADRSAGWARVLAAHGVGPEVTVAVLLPRSIEHVVAVWAIAAAGGVHVPLDPDHPVTRLQETTARVGARVVVAASARSDLGTCLTPADLDARASSAPPVPAFRSHPDHLAYVVHTSGSTGAPKGVAITHRGLHDLVWDLRLLGDGRDARILAAASPTVDASVAECFLALAHRAPLVLVPPDVTHGAELTDVIARSRATHALLTPRVLATLSPADVPTLRSVSSVGEECPPEVAAAWSIGRDFRNEYGPTETTVWATRTAPVRPDARVVATGSPVRTSIGRPVRGTRALVLDAALRPTPLGVAGELYVDGPHLARGYVGAPDRTAERFVAVPVGASVPGSAGTAGTRMYRTGDLVRWTAAGDLEFLGRTDLQISLRGRRIEPGEIETALRSLPGVADAVVVAHEGVRLVAYVVPDETDGPGGTAEVDGAELRPALAALLPRAVLPSVITVLPSFPTTPSGKIDRRALPAPTLGAVRSRPAATPAETLVAQVYAEVLELTDAPGADDDFLVLGGHSLTATRVAALLSARTARPVSVRTILEAGTVAAVAAELGPLASAPTATRTLPTLLPRPERSPLSYAQHRLWFVGRMDPDGHGYVVPLVLRLTGRPDVRALDAALVDVVTRHEVLRTVYPVANGMPYQHVLDPPETVLTTGPSDDAPPAFDVTTDRPLRAHLTTADDASVLTVHVHHIAADGGSLAPLTRDLTTAYAARRAGHAPSWSPLPFQYVDHALRERAADSSAAVLDHWRARLAGLDVDRALPTDHPRTDVVMHPASRITRTLSAADTTALRRTADRRRVTVFMAVWASVSTVLAQWTGRDDVAVGTAVARRDDPMYDDLIGLLVETLVLRVRLDRQGTVDDLLDTVRADLTRDYEQAGLPFERLVDDLGAVRAPGRHPLVQAMLTTTSAATPTLEAPDLTITPLTPSTTPTQFDLVFAFREEAGRFHLEVTYASDLYLPTTAARLADGVLAALRALPRADPDAPLSVLGLAPRPTAPRLGPPSVPPRTLADLVDAAASAAPDRIAVLDVTTGNAATYAEVATRAHRIARELIACGAGPERVVALALRRGLDHAVALRAVAATGAAVVCVDPDHPASRTLTVLETSGAGWVITAGEDGERTAAIAPWIPRLVLGARDTEEALARRRSTPLTDDDRVAPIRLDQPAYVVFTSGSTGTPKGVVVTHRGLADAAESQRLRATDLDVSRVLAVSSTTFDASMGELLTALGTAGTLVISPPGVQAGPELALVIRDAAVTTVVVTPRVLDTVPVDGLDCVRVVVVGGEELPPHVVDRWAPGRRLHNDYGPSETTVWATATTPLRAGAPVTIGHPVRGAAGEVLGDDLHPVPDGTVGELYVTGSGVARGYVGDPAQTAARFVAAPGGVRRYRTGDLTRWTANVSDNAQGPALTFHGRTDHQLSVRGVRVEPGEIEAAVRAHEGVRDVAVVMHRDEAGVDRLVAHVVGDVVPAEVRATAARRLPRSLVPDRVGVLPALPRTSSGKLDRRALPAPVVTAARYRAPATPTERVVATAFAAVLGRDRVGRDDDFFAIGGTSLDATKVAAHLSKSTGLDRALRAVVTHGTVAAIAASIDADVSTSIPDAVLVPVARLSDGDGPPAVFCIHPMMGLAWPYVELSRYLDPRAAVWGVQTPALTDPGFLPATMDELVNRYVDEIVAVDPRGPYHLLGWSVGGVLAHAIADAMARRGIEVASVILLDPVHSLDPDSIVKREQNAALFGDADRRPADAATLGPDELWSVWSSLGGDQLPLTDVQARLVTAAMLRVYELVDTHVPPTIDADVLVIDSTVTAAELMRSSEFWSTWCTGHLRTADVSFRHGELMSSEALVEVGPLVAAHLANVSSPA